MEVKTFLHNYKKNKLEKRFKKTVSIINSIFQNLDIENKPTLEFNYDNDKRRKYMGVYRDNTSKITPNHIILYIAKIKKKDRVAIILCHELGHWYHFTHENDSLTALNAVIRANKMSRNREYYEAVTIIENFADEYGKKFSKIFGCENEFELFSIHSKEKREEIDKEYFAINKFK